MENIIRVGSTCLTSKISDAYAWRGLCVSTERDKHTRSLHRLVRLSISFRSNEYRNCWIGFVSYTHGLRKAQFRAGKLQVRTQKPLGFLTFRPQRTDLGVACGHLPVAFKR